MEIVLFVHLAATYADWFRAEMCKCRTIIKIQQLFCMTPALLDFDRRERIITCENFNENSLIIGSYISKPLQLDDFVCHSTAAIVIPLPKSQSFADYPNLLKDMATVASVGSMVRLLFMCVLTEGSSHFQHHFQ